MNFIEHEQTSIACNWFILQDIEYASTCQATQTLIQSTKFVEVGDTTAIMHMHRSRNFFPNGTTLTPPPPFPKSVHQELELHVHVCTIYSSSFSSFVWEKEVKAIESLPDIIQYVSTSSKATRDIFLLTWRNKSPLFV